MVIPNYIIHYGVSLMNILEMFRIDAAVAGIDLNMTPIDTFGLLVCRGDMPLVRCRKELFCLPTPCFSAGSSRRRMQTEAGVFTLRTQENLRK